MNVRILPTFGTRCQYLRKFSRSRWPVSYHWPINHQMDYRATKRLPTLARNFLSTAQREMGVTVFMVASYRNAEGAGSISVYVNFIKFGQLFKNVCVLQI